MCKLEVNNLKSGRHWDGGLNVLGLGKVRDTSAGYFKDSRAKMKPWLKRLVTTLLVWTCVIQFVGRGEGWGPRLLKSWPSCSSSSTDEILPYMPSIVQKKVHFPPKSE